MKTVILVGLLAALAGCDRSDPTVNEAAHARADNTKVNERDKGGTLTPIDQGNNEVDLGITQKIRQAVMKDDTLSVTAKNVKIITVKGMVTLRGPVKNDKERTDIAAMAQNVAGVTRVDNQLEIAAN
jgi:hyperosmotically inducible protein